MRETVKSIQVSLPEDMNTALMYQARRFRTSAAALALEAIEEWLIRIEKEELDAKVLAKERAGMSADPDFAIDLAGAGLEVSTEEVDSGTA